MRPQKRRKKGTLRVLIGLLAVLIVVQLLRPIGKPKIALAINTTQTINGKLNIHWPYNTQDAIALYHNGFIDKTQNQSPYPTASVAKIMTAYIVLRDHPLKPGQDGPTLTITKQDVQEYINDKNNGQSLVKVAVGEKLSERQMLEALLLPSANNIATLLAKFDAHSVKNFVERMNKTAKGLGMTHTHYADPAGISLNTVSSAYDQVLLAQKAFEIPTFRHIVDMAQATLPVCGTVYNVNYVLGKNGIVGIKTGSIPEIGANYVFAAKVNVSYEELTLIGSIFGANGKEPLMTALNGAITAINDVKSSLNLLPIIKKNQLIGKLVYPNGLTVNVVAKNSVDSVVWPSKQLYISVHINKNLQLPIKRNETVGNLDVDNKKVPLIAQTNLNKPTLLQRLTRL